MKAELGVGDVDLVQHEVDDYVGDGDVEPDRKREARDSAMHSEAAGQREKKRGEHHGQGDNGKDDVDGQDGQVRGAHRAVTGENRVAVQRVVHDVTDKKNGREYEGKQHAGAMRFPVVMFDKI